MTNEEILQTDSQLQILNEVNRICESNDIHIWLRGGWAIDFLLGGITRSHEDLDLVTWVSNREVMEEALVKEGFERLPISDRQTDFRKNEVDIQFLYMTQTDGSISPHNLPEWLWRADSLPPGLYQLNGISMRVVSPQQLLEEKQVYEQIGRKPRDKDQESKRILQKIIEHMKN
ncbi:hypothetical protein GCM10008967_30400 [Bacillus carboniphilus]|uniref:Aminoglycoside adenylyltransferase n=1 Tax=Bacillus carboniphilus TaxID=86663 RepID=A0ABN0WHJ8_9BACI